MHAGLALISSLVTHLDIGGLFPENLHAGGHQAVPTWTQAWGTAVTDLGDTLPTSSHRPERRWAPTRHMDGDRIWSKWLQVLGEILFNNLMGQIKHRRLFLFNQIQNVLKSNSSNLTLRVLELLNDPYAWRRVNDDSFLIFKFHKNWKKTVLLTYARIVHWSVPLHNLTLFVNEELW